MKSISKFFSFKLFLLIFFAAANGVAASNSGFVYSGRILRPDGSPINSGSLTITVSVHSPAPTSCLLYQERFSGIDMTNKNGTFSVTLGLALGTRIDSTGIAFSQVMSNAVALNFPGLTCASGTTYDPGLNDERVMSATFNDGAALVTVDNLEIKSVPYAMQAAEVGGFGILNIPRISTAGGSTVELTKNEYEFLKNLAIPAALSATPCAANQILKVNAGGTAWECAADSGGGGESTTVTNLGFPGPGAAIGALNGTAVELKKLLGTADQITVTQNANDITFSLAPAILGFPIAAPATPANNGQAIRWNGAAWEYYTPNSGSVTGVTIGANSNEILSNTGTAAAPILTFANGTATGQTFYWDNTATDWKPGLVRYPHTAASVSLNSLMVGDPTFADTVVAMPAIAAPSILMNPGGGGQLIWDKGDTGEFLKGNAGGGVSWQPITAGDLPDLGSDYWKLGGNNTAAVQKLGSTSAQAINIVTADTSRIYIKNTGEVGINGVTNPLAAMHIGEGALRIDGAEGNDNAKLILRETGAGKSFDFQAHTNHLEIGEPGVANNLFTIEAGAGANALYIRSGGHVGMGTASSTSGLHVAVDNSKPSLTLSRNDATAVWNFRQSSTLAGLADSNAMNLYTTTTAADFGIRTTLAGDANFMVNAAGKVGIATNAPDTKLHVHTASNTEEVLTVGTANTVLGNRVVAQADSIEHYYGPSDGTATASRGRFKLSSNAVGDGILAGTDAGAILLRQDSGQWSGVVGGSEVTLVTGGTSTNQTYDASSATTRMRVNATGVSIGTTAPTHSLTMPAASTGTAYYNTADQTVNYERVREYWSGNVFNIVPEFGGTGTMRNINIGQSTAAAGLTLNGGYASMTLQNVSPNISFGRVMGNPGMLAAFGGTFNNNNGNTIALSVSPTISQTGTGGYTALLVNPTESTVGTGAKLLADFQVGGVSRALITNTGAFKIGTSAETCPIMGAGGFRYNAGAMEFCDGTNWIPLSASAGTVTGTGTQNRITKWTNGTGGLGDSLLFDSGTSVGIGTTTPGTLEGTSFVDVKFHTVGALATTHNTPRVIFDESDQAANTRLMDIAILGQKLHFRKYNDDSSSVVEMMTLNRADGNLGIGTTTPATVVEASTDSAVNNGFPILATQRTTALGTGIMFRNTADSRSSSIQLGAEGGAIQGNIVFNVNGNGTTQGSEAMRITSTGNVGIGTATPTLGKLQVTGGNIYIGDNTNAAGYLDINSRGFIGYNGSNDVVVQGSTSKGIQFNVNNATPGSGNAMYVKSDGNVGIGTMNPVYPLDVKGTMALGEFSGTNGGILFRGTHATKNAGITYDGNTLLVGNFGIGNQALQLGETNGSLNTVRILNRPNDAQGNGLQILPTIVQTGASSYTGLLLNVTETTVGTGAKNLVDFQVNSSSLFRIDNTGKIFGDGSGLTGVSASGALLSGLTAANAVNTIDNTLHAQTWNWSTADTENPLTLTADALTTGSILNITTAGTAVLNSTNGLLNVANTSADTGGVLARFQSNSTAGSGLTVLADGNVGIGTAAPTIPLSVNHDGHAAAVGTGANVNTYLSMAGSRASVGYSGTSAFLQGAAGKATVLVSNGAATPSVVVGATSQNVGIGGAISDTATLAGSVMTVLASGNVGINAINPTGTFEVQGGTAAAATNGKNIIMVAQAGGNTANGGNVLINPGLAGAGGVNGYLQVGNGAANSVFLYNNEINTNNNGQPLYINARRMADLGTGSTVIPDTLMNPTGGSVGIGTITPGSKLHVLQNSGAAILDILTVSGYGNAGLDRGASILMQVPGSTSSIDGGRIATGITSGGVGTVNTYMAFSTATAGTVGEKVRISSAGNVGIGTADPSLAKLQVAAGTATTDVNIANLSQTWNNAGVLFTGIKSNIVDTASDANSLLIDLQVGGASRFRVDKAGNITSAGTLAATAIPLSGITAAGAVNTIDNTLHAQTWNWSTADTENPLTLTADALTTGSILNITTAGTAVLNSTNGLLNVANTSADTGGVLARFQSNSTAGSGLTVLADGNVGVGTSTPAYPLAVTGNVHIKNAAAQSSRMWLDATGQGAVTQAYITVVPDAGSAQQYNIGVDSADNVFKIRGSAGFAGTAGISMNQSGNVGIGVASPTHKLEVSGAGGGNGTVLNKFINTDAPTSGQSGSVLWLAMPNMATGSASELNIGPLASNNNRANINFNYAGAGSTSNTLAFGFYGNNNLLNVLANGAVGVGTTNPAAKLHVSGGRFTVENAVVTAAHSAQPLAYDTADIYSTIYANNQDGGLSIHAKDGVGNSRWSQRFALKSNGGGTPRAAIDLISRDGTNAVLSNVEAMSFGYSGNIGIGVTAATAGARLDITGTGTASSSIIIPRDSVANRPTGVNGMMRYASDTNKFEAFENGAWVDMIGGTAATANALSNITDISIVADSDTNGSGGIQLRTGASVDLAILNDGKVGIGIAAPTEKLHVENGNILVNPSETTGAAAPLLTEGLIKFNNRFDNAGNSTANKISLFDDGTNRYGIGLSSNTMNYFTGASGKHQFWTGHQNEATPGSVIMAITDTSVGVGVVAPTHKFHVDAGHAFISNSGANPYLYVGETTAGTAGTYGFYGWDNTNDNLILGTGAGGSVVNITENNRVGIGATMTAPNHPLEVAGNIGATTSNAALYIKGVQAGGNEWTMQTVDADGRFRIFENSNGANEVFTISETGKVGIGTASPTYLLQTSATGANVNRIHQGSEAGGNEHVLASVGGSNSITMQKANASPNFEVLSGNHLGSWITTGYDGSNYRTASIIRTEADANFEDLPTQSSPGRIVFLTTPINSNTATERVRIDNAGKVGIGSNNPGAQLQVDTKAVSRIGQIIKWGAAGQTANLLEFQNDSGTILSRIDKDGKFYGDGSGLTGVASNIDGLSDAIYHQTRSLLFIGENAGENVDPNNAFNVVAVGRRAMRDLTVGGANTAVGYLSMGMATSASDNTAIGISALEQNLSGYGNTGLGASAGKNLTGGNNTAVGAGSLNGVPAPNATGQYNTAVGYNSGTAITSGSGNVIMGAMAADNLTSGGNNIVIGYNIDVPVAAGNNQLNIGNFIFGTGFDGAGTTVSAGSVGIGTSSPSSIFHIQVNDAANSATTTGMTISHNIAAGAGAHGIGTQIVFQADNSADVMSNAAIIRAQLPYAGDGTNGTEQGALVFLTNTAGSNTEKMRIDYLGNVNIGSGSGAVSLDISDRTDSLRLPAGTTAQRPGTPAVGDMRYNSDVGGAGYGVGSPGTELEFAL